MLNETSGDLVTISNILQRRNMDLIECCRQVAHLRDQLRNYHTSDRLYERVYMAAIEKLAAIIGVDGILLTRDGLPRRQYCKESIYLPYLSDLDDQLGDRFGSHHKQVYSLQYLIPVFFGPDDYKVIESFRFYAEHSDGFDITEQSFMDEYRRWKARFSGMNRDELPVNASTSLEFCASVGREWFPHLFDLLKILVTLPVTSVDVEFQA